jgi:RimJ/RimL family protein N-acetyltransferase
MHPAPVEWSEHLKWLDGVLRDPCRHLYVVEDDAVQVGSLRLDGKTLSWTVNPDLRGQGYGTRMLKEFLERFPGEYIAEVKLENLASQRMCKRNGFREISRRDSIIRYANH